ncbi:MAG: restriction endonuclease [Proteobacteria bacterium]|nr:restriction endonuclease [Pseudomonadota bacterium]MBU2227781.1 restriction endonuclease [Pseudomonadota bacterium]MBU2261805.1 restriction endonuclease [Pseudomonadota bacterium]
MRIVETYSHLNGEEYLIARQPSLYQEIKDVIAAVDANGCRTKRSREKTMPGKRLYSPKALNREFARHFNAAGWSETRYNYYVTTNRSQMEEMVRLPLKQQKTYLLDQGVVSPIKSYKQTDFVKNQIAVEVQFGKYAFVAFDLFVKHLLFYSGGIIHVGVEILPMMAMSKDPAGGRMLSTGIAYYEGEVYNILRHGRTSPPVPLLIIGIVP